MNLHPKNHTDFILSPLSKIIIEVVSASTGIGDGIETYPTYDYLMQSVFLKMTGAQEQKMKCICWELATHDYEYRYDRYTNPKEQLRGCSTFREKQIIYNDIVTQIVKYNNCSFNIFFAKEDKERILNETSNFIRETFSNTNLVSWTQKNFIEYRSLWSTINIEFFAVNEKNLFADRNGKRLLKTIYKDYLHKSRNRIAHNTKSYQQNLPTLKTLMDDDYKYENYFMYFSILILIDKILIHLYKKYLSTIEDM